MNELWQYVAVAAIVLSALIYLAVYYFRRRKARTGCRACRLLQAAARLPESKTVSAKRSTVN